MRRNREDTGREAYEERKRERGREGGTEREREIKRALDT